MNIAVYNDPVAFRDRCRDWLLQEEANNNGLISAIDLLAENSKAYDPPYWLGLLEDDGEILAVAYHCRPDGLIFSEMNEEGARLVYDAVRESIPVPHRLMGPEDTCDELAKHWRESAQVNVESDGHWNVHWVKELVPPGRPANGQLRKGVQKDADWVRQWGDDYGKEKPAVVDVAQFMLRKLRREELYVWDDDGPRTMIGVSGFTDHGVRISAVFTPREHRGKGYASIAVAEMTQQLLDAGHDFVTLHTKDGDAAERVYRRLGYEQIGRRGCYLLEETET